MVDKIQDGVVVTMVYSMSVDGEEIESAPADAPLYYLHGSDNIVPGLEDALEGKGVGAKLTVTLAPEDAYGEYDEEDVQEVDIADIEMPVGGLNPGDEIEIEDADGDIYMAVVKEVRPDVLLLDFNNPMAGKSITFNVEVLALRAATEEEIEFGEPEEYAEMYDDEHDHYDDEE